MSDKSESPHLDANEQRLLAAAAEAAITEHLRAEEHLITANEAASQAKIRELKDLVDQLQGTEDPVEQQETQTGDPPMPAPGSGGTPAAYQASEHRETMRAHLTGRFYKERIIRVIRGALDGLTHEEALEKVVELIKYEQQYEEREETPRILVKVDLVFAEPDHRCRKD
ncbi:uncharacterized protein LTR77_001965 [Saxophila tyrrhenica]|uniref:Uncharacterized protein n=1 Tax=Saxophila tyrrhenica TaxID=1690608 RepID=A0AAV9PHQ9_9PEZI|nr:hypothetical protein LTR77_001965 [Saxophila tyrrhenica]